MVANQRCARLGTGSVGNSNQGEQYNIHPAGNQNWRDDDKTLQRAAQVFVATAESQTGSIFVYRSESGVQTISDCEAGITVGKPASLAGFGKASLSMGLFACKSVSHRLACLRRPSNNIAQAIFL